MDEMTHVADAAQQAYAAWQRAQQECRPVDELTDHERAERDERERVEWERQQQELRERNVEVTRERLPKRFREADPADAFPAGSVYAHGGVGTGKTYRAAATALGAAGNGERVLWLNVPALLESIRASFNGGEQVPPSDKLTANIDVIVLDDLGAERATDWARETLYGLVNRAYEQELRLIVTSNVKPSDLVKGLGQRLVSRLLEECVVIKLTGPDRRRQTAAERVKRDE